MSKKNVKIKENIIDDLETTTGPELQEQEVEEDLIDNGNNIDEEHELNVDFKLIPKTVTAMLLNIRKGASKSSKIVTVVKKNDILHINPTNDTDSFHEVVDNNTFEVIGYVMKKFVV